MAAHVVLLVDHAEAEPGELAVEVGEDVGQGGSVGADLGAAGGVAAELGRYDHAGQAGSPAVTE